MVFKLFKKKAKIQHSLNPEGKEQLADYAEYLGMTVKYKKDNSIPNQATG